jgi:hypothetical protein
MMMMMMRIQIISLLFMCWHNSHKANYTDSTGTKRKYGNTINQQNAFNRHKEKLTPKKNSINNIIIFKEKL